MARKRKASSPPPSFLKSDAKVQICSENDERIDDHLDEQAGEAVKSDETVKAGEAVKSDETVKTDEAGMEKKEEVFSVGEAVEVRFDKKGYQVAWFPATILKVIGQGKYSVQFWHLNSDDNDEQKLIEEADARNIKHPPPDSGVTKFKLLNEVDAFDDCSWWRGVIIKVLGNSKYKVFLRKNYEEFVYDFSKLRLHQELVDGKWVTTSKVDDD